MGQTTFSFEIFPPNKESAAEKLTETLDELVGLSPDFISVTCTNKNDDLARLTVKLAGYVKNRLNVLFILLLLQTVRLCTKLHKAPFYPAVLGLTCSGVVICNRA